MILVVSLTVNVLLCLSLLLVNREQLVAEANGLYRKLYGSFLIWRRIRKEQAEYKAAPKQASTVTNHNTSYWEPIDEDGPVVIATHYPQGGTTGTGGIIYPDSYDVGGILWDGESFRRAWRQAAVATVVPQGGIKIRPRQVQTPPASRPESRYEREKMEALVKEYDLGGSVTGRDLPQYVLDSLKRGELKPGRLISRPPEFELGSKFPPPPESEPKA